MEVRYAWNTPGMDEKGVALPAYFTKHRFQPLPAGLNQQPSKIPPSSRHTDTRIENKGVIPKLCVDLTFLCQLEGWFVPTWARFCADSRKPRQLTHRKSQ